MLSWQKQQPLLSLTDGIDVFKQEQTCNKISLKGCTVWESMLTASLSGLLMCLFSVLFFQLCHCSLTCKDIKPLCCRKWCLSTEFRSRWDYRVTKGSAGLWFCLIASVSHTLVVGDSGGFYVSKFSWLQQIQMSSYHLTFPTILSMYNIHDAFSVVLASSTLELN